MHTKFNAILSKAPKNKTFKTDFGELSSLQDLRNTLLNKGKAFYHNYVTEDENHFANWVEGVFKDKDLAKSMRNAKTHKQTVSLLEKRITYLKLWLEFNKEETVKKAKAKHHKKKDSKEDVFQFLNNSSLALDKMMGLKPYNPSFQVFETLSNFKPPKEEKAVVPVRMVPIPDAKPKKVVMTNASKETKKVDEVKAKEEEHKSFVKKFENIFWRLKVK